MPIQETQRLAVVGLKSETPVAASFLWLVPRAKNAGLKWAEREAAFGATVNGSAAV
jgi:hypothetical protein